ncbi:MAG: hypothetical protein CSA33_08380 [Desulfobulbus propionicus]|nr:MAG: hypothetical protein CSA33_08380 [Desulfobulbus propionicus]
MRKVFSLRPVHTCIPRSLPGNTRLVFCPPPGYRFPPSNLNAKLFHAHRFGTSPDFSATFWQKVPPLTDITNIGWDLFLCEQDKLGLQNSG